MKKIHSYREALQWLFQLTRFGERFDLGGPHSINMALGNPLGSVKSILIGGTNGKGSTCIYLEKIMIDADFTVGRFSSPHLISFCERICINGDPIAPKQVIHGVNILREITNRNGITISFFEATWAIATILFKEANVEYVIWEVGLGGRLDATNVCEPIASAIVSIGLDHTAILGDTLEKIAKEKSAIFRPNQPRLTSTTDEGLIALKKVYPNPITEASPLSNAAFFPTTILASNAALASEIARSIGITPNIQLLPTCHLPGRFEYLKGIYLDSAHNPPAAFHVAQWLQKKRAQEQRPIHVIFGASEDKDVTGVMRELGAYIDKITWVSPIYPRCSPAERVQQLVGDLLPTQVHQEIIPSVMDALDARASSDQALTLICGSCFLVGEARAYLLNLPFPEEKLMTNAR